jgi:hypothetical protein
VELAVEPCDVQVALGARRGLVLAVDALEVSHQAGIAEIAEMPQHTFLDQVDVEQRLQVLEVQAPHVGTAIGMQHHQALGREAIERLARRRARELELLHKKGRVDAAAGLERHVEDAVADRVDRFLGEGSERGIFSRLRSAHGAESIRV